MSRTVEQQKVEIGTKFAEMCNYGLDMFPPSITMSLVRKAITVASAASPTWFIESVGPFFYTHRKRIEAHDLQYFIDRSWAEQKASWGFMGPLADQWESIIKTGLQHAYDHHLDELIRIPKSLVAMYCQYLLLCRQ